MKKFHFLMLLLACMILAGCNGDADGLENAKSSLFIPFASNGYVTPLDPTSKESPSFADEIILNHGPNMINDGEMIPNGWQKKFVESEPHQLSVFFYTAYTGTIDLDFVVRYAYSDATLCVENLPRTCLGRDSSDILALLSADARLRVCFDTNHLLEEDAIDFIRAVGNKILTIHVSDYDRLNERHWLAGEGCVDWPSLYSALLSTGYSGAWLYEVNLQAPPSITRAGDLTFGDFAHNASEIFSGKRPTPLGTPNEGLTSWK